jgi:DNA-directed RNA polymerase specialized sigma24 family protein
VPPEDLEDAVQDALLWAWERRHCAHVTDFPAYISTVIRQKLRQRYAGRA